MTLRNKLSKGRSASHARAIAAPSVGEEKWAKRRAAAKGETMLKRKALVVVVLGSVFFLCPLLYSQANGVLSGTVADKTGSVIAGATVKITSQGTGLTREVKTDGSGHYLAPLLPVAFYTIRVESQGFQTTEQKDVRLQVDEQREIDFSLNPASVSSDGGSQRHRSCRRNHEPNPRPGHHLRRSRRPSVERT